MRFSLLVLLAIGAPIGGAAAGVMRIAYPEPYLAGAGALGVLIFGQVAFALFVIGATILTGAGRPLPAAIIALVSLVVVLVATRLAIGHAGLEDNRALAATALGTSAGTAVALLAVGFTVYKSFGAFLPIASALRGLFAGAAGFAAARVIPHETALGALPSRSRAASPPTSSRSPSPGRVGKTELAALRAIVGRRKRS
ncbi:MAG: hypothetical protein M5U28_46040 [Sandaracinaceae bacterium]|nr:hypothetical protein [Sandaracinaceae bacterium]